MRFLFFFVVLLSPWISEASQRIVTVKTIHEIASDILYDDTNYWLIFDIDDVLFQGAEALSHSTWFERSIQGMRALGTSEQEAWEALYPEWLAIQHQGSIKQIETAIPLLINKVQHQNKIVFAYSERKFCAQEITFNQLASINLSFEKSNLPDTKLPSMISFTKGVLFGAEIRKGPGLQYFLDAQTSLPEKIIYIDNEKYNVLRIGEICKHKKISYLGVVYTASQYLPPVYLPDIAKIQYLYRQKLISNEAAALLSRHRLDK
ncbi:DUF2608 domain-containing protein [Chlamydia sp.]|uniref:DUF2608 domain-containing protein n=1 Tax=Chlamydia sp. TaxID=35827 RepID=UPI0025C16093|nr:DUF2608 domain-containing protein [Chlamydia sp.]MBQ8498227.1 DUF2608 domain-containing protein [Chlamydia sp.]